MREIKFRAIKDDISDPCWLYGTLHVRKDSFGTIYTIEYEAGDYIYYQNSVIKNSIGQFTGLKDINGAEIYEGDIVKGIDFYLDENFERTDEISSEVIGEVYFDNKIAGWALKGENLLDGFDPLSHFNQFEVIGNIYKTPQLLEP